MGAPDTNFSIMSPDFLFFLLFTACLSYRSFSYSVFRTYLVRIYLQVESAWYYQVRVRTAFINNINSTFQDPTPKEKRDVAFYIR